MPNKAGVKYKYHVYSKAFEWVLSPDPKKLLMFVPQVGESVYFSKTLYQQYDSEVLVAYNDCSNRFDPNSIPGFPAECTCTARSVKYEVDYFLCIDDHYLPTCVVDVVLELDGEPRKKGQSTVTTVRIAPYFSIDFSPIPPGVEFLVPMSRVQRGLSQGYSVGSAVAVPFVSEEDASHRTIYVGKITKMIPPTDAGGTSYFQYATVKWTSSPDDDDGEQDVAVWELFPSNVTESQVLESEKPEGLYLRNPPQPGDEFSQLASSVDQLKSTESWRVSYGKIPRGRPEALVAACYITPLLIGSRIANGYYRTVDALSDDVRQLVDTCERFINAAANAEVNQSEKSRLKECAANFKPLIRSLKKYVPPASAVSSSSSAPAPVTAAEGSAAHAVAPLPLESPLPMMTPTPSGAADGKRKRVIKVKEDPYYEPSKPKKSKVSPEKTPVAASSATPVPLKEKSSSKAGGLTLGLETPVAHSALHVDIPLPAHSKQKSQQSKMRRPTITQYTMLTPAPSSQPAFRLEHPFQEELRLKELADMWSAGLGPAADLTLLEPVVGSHGGSAKTKISSELEQFVFAHLKGRHARRTSLEAAIPQPMDVDDDLSEASRGTDQLLVDRILAVPLLTPVETLPVRVRDFLGRCKVVHMDNTGSVYYRLVSSGSNLVATQVFAVSSKSSQTTPANPPDNFFDTQSFAYIRFQLTCNIVDSGSSQQRSLSNPANVSVEVQQVSDDDGIAFSLLTVRCLKDVDISLSKVFMSPCGKSVTMATC